MRGSARTMRRPSDPTHADRIQRRATTHQSPTVASILDLQRDAGNEAVTQALGHGATEQNGAATDAAAGRAQELVEAVVAMATEGRTLLLAQDVRDALEARAADPELAAEFDAALAHIDERSAEEGPIAPLTIAAGDVIRALERRFIHDKTRSTLDLLGEKRSRRYRNFKWDPADFPDGAKGPNEGRASEMIRQLGTIRPERRANSTEDAVIAKREVDRALEKTIQSGFVPVEGQEGHKLHPEAASSFVRMRAAAAADGVKLHVLDANRRFATARRRAAKAKNKKAVGDFSSHSLGLAVDLRLSTKGQRFKEIDTSPFQNVVDMHAAPAHKWMLLRGESFGWYPFLHEPWHWEYNPAGFRAAYRESIGLEADEAEAAGAAGTTPDGDTPAGVDSEDATG